MPLVKGRELNSKCQVMYFDSHYLRVFFGYLFDEGGRGTVSKKQARI